MKKNKVLTEKDKKDVVYFWGVLFGMSLTSNGVAGGVIQQAASILERVIRDHELMLTEDIKEVKMKTTNGLLNNKPKLKKLAKQGFDNFGEFMDALGIYGGEQPK